MQSATSATFRLIFHAYRTRALDSPWTRSTLTKRGVKPFIKFSQFVN